MNDETRDNPGKRVSTDVRFDTDTVSRAQYVTYTRCIRRYKRNPPRDKRILAFKRPASQISTGRIVFLFRARCNVSDEDIWAPSHRKTRRPRCRRARLLRVKVDSHCSPGQRRAPILRQRTFLDEYSRYPSTWYKILEETQNLRMPVYRLDG